MLLTKWMEGRYFWPERECKIRAHVCDHNRIKLSSSDQTGVYFLTCQSQTYNNGQ